MGGILDKIFGPGGFLGGAPGDTEAQKMQGELLRRMMGREGELYTPLMEILGSSTANADEAYKLATEGVDQIYPEVQDQITNLSLPPAVLDNLERIRASRLGDVNENADRMISSGMAGLAKNGMQSSTTAAGLGRRVSSALAPEISSIEGDFSKARTSMPMDIAKNKFSLATGNADLMSSATRDKYKQLLNPYLDMWGSSASIGATAPSVNNDPGQGGKNIGNIISLFA